MRVWLAVGRTDMRRGMNGLSLQVQEMLGRDPFAGDLFVFRGARGDLVKILWHDGLGLSLYAKRLERGFVPSASAGAASRFRRHSSPTCSTGSTGVTRFTHSDRNARDRPFHRAFFAGGRRGSVIPSPHGFAT
jgi:transposase